MTVRIIFRKTKRGDVDAIFIDEVANFHGDLTCYSHIGQHSSACPIWVYNETKPASPKEYKSLLKELRGVYKGYSIKVLKKLPNITTTLANIALDLQGIPR